MTELVGAAGEVLIDTKKLDKLALVESIKPMNGWVQIKALKPSELIQLVGSSSKATMEWRFEVTAVGRKYLNEHTGKWADVPQEIKQGVYVTVTPGSWHNFPFREWTDEGYFMVHWAMITSVVRSSRPLEVTVEQTTIESVSA